jgi:hypothetical protein
MIWGANHLKRATAWPLGHDAWRATGRRVKNSQPIEQLTDNSKQCKGNIFLIILVFFLTNQIHGIFPLQ